MKILHLTTSFPLQQSSISGIFVYRLISCFSADIKTIVLTPDSRLPVQAPPGTFSLHTFRYGPKKYQTLAHEPGGLPAALRRARWHLFLLPLFLLSMLWNVILQARRCDLIHAHWTINGVVAGIAGFLTRTPVITTLRGEDVNRGQSSLLHRCLLALTLRFSPAVATVSSSIYEDIQTRFPEYAAKLSFVPNGVSEPLFALPLTRKKKQTNILILGSLIPVKAIDVILKSLLICGVNDQYHLLIAGSGPEEEKLRHLVETEGLVDNVTFAGQVPPDKVINLLAKTDILVQASYREGRPNSVLEAMAAGVAVVGSDINGINELLCHGQNGLLFPAGDVEKLASQLQQLLDSPEQCRQLGEKARQTLRDKNLTWPKCAAAYESLYQQLMEKK